MYEAERYNIRTRTLAFERQYAIHRDRNSPGQYWTHLHTYTVIPCIMFAICITYIRLGYSRVTHSQCCNGNFNCIVNHYRRVSSTIRDTDTPYSLSIHIIANDPRVTLVPVIYNLM